MSSHWQGWSHWLLEAVSTVRVKIIAWVAVTLLLVITGMTFVLLDLTRNDLVEQLALRGEWALDTLVRQLDQGFPANGEGSGGMGDLEEFVRRTPNMSQIEGGLLVDAKLRPLGCWGVARMEEATGDRVALARVVRTRQAAHRMEGGQLLVYRPYIREGQVLGALRLSLSLKLVWKIIGHYQRNVFQVILIESALILFLISLLLGALVLRPVEQLVHVAERIADGDLAYRVEVVHRGEIGRLARAFNQMLERLEEARENRDRHILDLEKAYRALKRTQAQLVASEKMASVGRLAAGIAHEIGNPLSAIQGYSEILLLEETDPERRIYLERTQLEAERITKIIRHLLEYSKPGKTFAQDLPTPVDLRQVVERALELVKTQRSFSKFTLKTELAQSGPVVLGDEHQLTQLLINLLLNAQQAMGDRGEITVLTGEKESAANYAAEGLWPDEPPAVRETAGFLAVRDKGPGIDPQDMDKLFEPFFTTKAPGHGTGLGLFVVHTIVEGLGGQVQIASRRGEGTCFVVWLSETSGGGNAA